MQRYAFAMQAFSMDSESKRDSSAWLKKEERMEVVKVERIELSTWLLDVRMEGIDNSDFQIVHKQ